MPSPVSTSTSPLSSVSSSRQWQASLELTSGQRDPQLRWCTFIRCRIRGAGAEPRASADGQPGACRLEHALDRCQELTAKLADQGVYLRLGASQLVVFDLA